MIIIGISFIKAAPSEKVENKNTTVLLQGLEKNLDFKTPIQEYNYFDWINDDGILLPLKGNAFWAGTSNMADSQKGKVMQDDITLINESFLKPMQASTTKYFEQEGFKLSPQNTFVYQKDVFVQLRSGYEAGATKCVAMLYQTTDPFGRFFCGEIDQQQIKLQKDFIPLFGNTMRSADPLSFRVDKVGGNFARGSASDPIMGYVWIAKKIDGKWKVVWKANEIGLCSDMKKYDIPKSIYDSCYTPGEY